MNCQCLEWLRSPLKCTNRKHIVLFVYANILEAQNVAVKYILNPIHFNVLFLEYIKMLKILCVMLSHNSYDRNIPNHFFAKSAYQVKYFLCSIIVIVILIYFFLLFESD